MTLILVIPGFVFLGVRIRLRGRTPSDAEFTTRILNAIIVSTVFALSYILILGSIVADPATLHEKVLQHPRLYAAVGLCAAFAVPVF